MNINTVLRRGLTLATALAMAGSMLACGQAKPDPTKDTDPSSATISTAATDPKQTQPAVPATTAPVKKPDETQSVETEPVETLDIPDDPIDDALEFDAGLKEMQAHLKDCCAIAGVVYLGYTDSLLGDDDFFDSLQNQAALEKYPFIRNIGFEFYAKSAGGQVFCIVPTDHNSTVELSTWDIDTNTKKDVMMYNIVGYPILIQGNVSDIVPNLGVTITDSEGNVLEDYRPCLNLESPSVMTPQYGPTVLDLSGEDIWLEEPQDEDESLLAIRSRMEPSGAVAGVIYLGSTDRSYTDPDFFDSLQNQAIMERYPFIRNIDYFHYCQNAGSEVYCIVPFDPDAHVEIVAWDTDSDTADFTMLNTSSGNPVLIQCNSSDIMANTAITIQDNFSNYLYRYRPHLSLRDGTVATPSDGPLVLDLSD